MFAWVQKLLGHREQPRTDATVAAANDVRIEADKLRRGLREIADSEYPLVDLVQRIAGGSVRVVSKNDK